MAKDSTKSKTLSKGKRKRAQDAENIFGAQMPQGQTTGEMAKEFFPEALKFLHPRSPGGYMNPQMTPESVIRDRQMQQEVTKSAWDRNAAEQQMADEGRKQFMARRAQRDEAFRRSQIAVDPSTNVFERTPGASAPSGGRINGMESAAAIAEAQRAANEAGVIDSMIPHRGYPWHGSKPMVDGGQSSQTVHHQGYLERNKNNPFFQQYMQNPEIANIAGIESPSAQPTFTLPQEDSSNVELPVTYQAPDGTVRDSVTHKVVSGGNTQQVFDPTNIFRGKQSQQSQPQQENQFDPTNIFKEKAPSAAPDTDYVFNLLQQMMRGIYQKQITGGIIPRTDVTGLLTEKP